MPGRFFVGVSLSWMLVWGGAAFAAAPKVDLQRLLAKVEVTADAAAKARASRDCTETIRSERLDSDGKVTHSSEEVIRLTHAGGKTMTVLVRDTRDGKDVTAEARKAREKKSGGSGGKTIRIEMSNPFLSGEQPKYQFRVLGFDSTDPDEVWIGFQPKGDSSPSLMIGRGKVTSDGKLCQLVMNPSDNPHFVDRLDMKMNFEGPDGRPGLLRSTEMDGEGGFLWIHKHMRGGVRYDYAPSPSVSKPATAAAPSSTP